MLHSTLEGSEFSGSVDTPGEIRHSLASLCIVVGGEFGWLTKILEFPSCPNMEAEEWGLWGSIGQSWEGRGWHHRGESLDGGFSSPGCARWLHSPMCFCLRALHVCAQLSPDCGPMGKVPLLYSFDRERTRPKSSSRCIVEVRCDGAVCIQNLGS